MTRRRDVGLDDRVNEYVREVRRSRGSLSEVGEAYPRFGGGLGNRLTDDTKCGVRYIAQFRIDGELDPRMCPATTGVGP